MEVPDFVGTPFAVRRNVAKVWRPLPADLWTAFDAPADYKRAIRREGIALAAVLALAGAVVGGAAGIGVIQGGTGDGVAYPLLGRASVPAGQPLPDSVGASGWYFVAGQSAKATLWTVLPPLCGWGFVRLLWIPLAIRSSPARVAARTFARYLSGVYLYVYLMIAAGLALAAILLALVPRPTETFRWWLWLFLFGESFFVPALMWIRLVGDDSNGDVFGQRRYTVLALYLVFFVVVPIAGMVPIVF